MHWLLLALLSIGLVGCSFNKKTIKPATLDFSTAEIEDPMAPDLLALEKEIIALEIVENDGQSIETAIVITGARTRLDKINSQNECLAKRFGKIDLDWLFIDNKYKRVKKKQYDIFTIKSIAKDQTFLIYFDSTDFYNNL